MITSGRADMITTFLGNWEGWDKKGMCIQGESLYFGKQPHSLPKLTFYTVIVYLDK